MLQAQARRGARRDRGYVPLAAQGPALWHAALIDHAEGLLLRASRLGAIGHCQLRRFLQARRDALAVRTR